MITENSIVITDNRNCQDSIRVYIPRKFRLSDQRIITLNTLSIWGGSDKEDETHKSWEFPGNFGIDMDTFINIIMKVCGANYKLARFLTDKTIVIELF